MSSSDSTEIVEACKAGAAAIGRFATVAVVDDVGMLLHLERHDSVGVVSVETTIRKARTASLYARPSSAMEQRIMERPAFLGMPDLLAVPGGLPLFMDGTCVGGVAVGGVDKDDEAVAQAGVERFAQLKGL